ncbi:aldose 1-epimerase [Nisaea sp.]|uniref:aldose 1-epimerase n=1 Tax=Nisaea sp. TaxID=2024842 RepID=UPI003B51A957
MTAAGMVRLSDGCLHADIWPANGGRIAGFFSLHGEDRFDWMVPAPASDIDSGASGSWGSFPLVPFSNRIRDGRFAWSGREHRISVSEQHAPHAIHGHGRNRSWTVERRTGTSLDLTYDHEGDDWPFAYRARQRFALEGEELVVEMTLVNTGTESMPGGLGHHPYLPWRDGIVLETNFGNVWPAADGILPAGPETVPETLDFSSGRPVPRGLDTGFGGWSGRARIHLPGDGLALDIECSPALGHVIIFTPAGEDFFCFEPVTHAIDAINLAARGVPETGQVAVAPGEGLEVSMRFRPRVIAD